jgi:hypothetical protein
MLDNGKTITKRVGECTSGCNQRERANILEIVMKVIG